MCKKMGWDVDSIEDSNARVLGFKESLVRNVAVGMNQKSRWLTVVDLEKWR
jgi:hypothetical protein